MDKIRRRKQHIGHPLRDAIGPLSFYRFSCRRQGGPCQRATRRVAADFLQSLLEVVPCQIHAVLTDNGTHFTSPGSAGSAAADIKSALECGELFRAHAFEFVCARHDIDHRLTKPNHPWINGQVERKNRTIKEATLRTYH